MNIQRRIKLLSAAGALSLMSLVGLIAAAPAQARTIAPDRPTATSYYTWWLPGVFLTPVGFDCTSGTFAGYSADFLGDTSVNVTEIDEQRTSGQWQALSIDNNNAAVISVNRWTGSIITSPPQPVSWGSLPYGESGPGHYEAWLQDSSFRGGAVFFTCP